MSPILVAVASASAAASAAGDANGGGRLLIAALLLLVAVGLVLLEVAVVSFGLLTVTALGCALAAILLAFAVSPMAGWGFILATGLAAVLTLAGGLRLLRRLVAAPPISAAAGYAEHSGADLAVGDVGMLSTEAWPTGRARFGAREVHVTLAAGGLPWGSPVRVQYLDGAVITVAAAPLPPPATPSPP